MHSLLAKCRKNSINVPSFMCRLFDVLVKPVLCQGAQVWGPDVFLQLQLKGIKSFLTNDVEKIQNNFFRSIGGIKKRVNPWITLREFRRYPLQVDWIRYAFKFWNKLVSMDRSRISYIAFQDSIEIMKQGCQQCWVYKMLQMASTLGLVASNVTTLPKTTILQLQFHYKDVKAAAQQFFDKVWREVHPDPRTAPTDKVLLSTYMNFGFTVLNIKSSISAHIYHGNTECYY